MKRNYFIYLSVLFLLVSLFLYLAFADVTNYQPIVVTGFNHDLIAENTNGISAGSSTTTSFDGQNNWANNVMYSVDFRGPTNTNVAPPFGLPSNGIIESTQNIGVRYQLEPYNGNNALLLINNSQSGTLTLSTSGSYEKIVVLASSADGQSTFDVVLNFSDGTSKNTSFTVQDWYGGSNYAIQGIGRVTRNDDFYAPNYFPEDADGTFSGDFNNPRLYDCIIDNTSHKNKVLTSLTITKTSVMGRTAILAVTGQKNANAPTAPVAVAATDIESSSFVANWEQVPGATSYKLDVATNLGFTNLVVGFNNLETGNAFSYVCTGLSNSTTYYYRVRAFNGDGGSFSSNTIMLTTAALSSDSTLKASPMIKGVVVTNIGTPATTLDSVIEGSVTLETIQSTNTTNTGNYITYFEANHIQATVHKIVKYPIGSNAANFLTDTAYDGISVIDNGDFFIIEIMAEDGSLSYYKIKVLVTPTLSSDATLFKVLNQFIVFGPEEGNLINPKVARIFVSNEISFINQGDFQKNHFGATVTFYGFDNTFTLPEADSLYLSDSHEAYVYLKVKAEDGLYCYYQVIVNRASNLNVENTSEAILPEIQAPISTQPTSEEPSIQDDLIQPTTELPKVIEENTQGSNLEMTTEKASESDYKDDYEGEAAVSPLIPENTIQNTDEIETEEVTNIVPPTVGPVEGNTEENTEENMGALNPVNPANTVASEALTGLFSKRTPVGPTLQLSLEISVGAKIEGKSVTVSAKGLKPFTEVLLTLYSTPQLIGSSFTDANGEVNLLAQFPNNLPTGAHTIIASGFGFEGESVQAVSAFELDQDGKVLAYVPPSQVLKPIAPNDARLMRALKANKPLYDVQRYPGTVVSIVVVFAGLGGLSSLGGLSKPSNRKSKATQTSSKEDSELIEAVAIEVDDVEDDLSEKRLKWGDRSILWKMPGTRIADNISVAVADKISEVSLLLKRLVLDGSWARAMFGSGGFLLWIIGALLGIYASLQVGYMALPPAYSVVLLIVVLGILDGAAGAIAWLVIAIAALFTGHITSFDDLRTLAGLSALFTSMVYLIGMRPIRRVYEKGNQYLFDRVMDYIMPALIVAIASSTLLEAINGLSGLELFTSENSMQIQWVAIAALWSRLALEDLTMWLFPKRCEKVRPKSSKEQKLIYQWGAILAYEVMFVLISGPFFGMSLALLCIMAMETIPWMLSFIEERFPNSKVFYKWYPGPTSIYMLTLLTVINILLSAWLINESSNYQQICTAFIFMLIPYTLAEIPGLFGREGESLRDSWSVRLFEMVTWFTFALITFEVVVIV